MKENIDEVLERYNPEQRVMTKQDYRKFRERYLAGAKDEVLQKYFDIAFFDVGFWLRSDYILNMRDENFFEDDLLETYFCVKDVLPTEKNFEKYHERLYQTVAEHLEELRVQEKEANVYLNYDYDYDLESITDKTENSGHEKTEKGNC